MTQMDFLVYSDGKGDIKEWNFRSKDIKPIKEFTNRQMIQKVFIKDEAILYIVNGNLWKEGYFHFEKIEKGSLGQENPAKKEVYLKEGSAEIQIIVEDVVFGDNHVLILGQNRKIYAWGDNYYGQLGLGNLMIPWTMEPQLIKLPMEIKRIFAYKNNSFAIDINDNLWVWGKNEFLGKNFRNNVFKPIMVLNQYKVRDIIMNDNRVIVVANLQTEHKEKTPKENKDQTKNETMRPDEKKEDGNEDAKSKKSERIETTERKEKGDKDKTPTGDLKKIESKMKPGVDKVGMGGGMGQAIHRFIETFDDGLEAIMEALEGRNDKMLQLRKFLLKENSKIKEIGLDNYWDKIYNLIDAKKNQGNEKISTRDLSIGNQTNILIACLNSIMCGNFSRVLDEDFIKYAREFPKDIMKVLSNRIEKGLLNDDNIKSFYENFKKMLIYFIRYKKIEVLVHRMAGVSFLMKSFKFNNILEAIKMIQDRDENVERKLYLINNSFKTIELLLEKTKQSFNNLNQSYVYLDQTANQDYENDSELFIYKHCIEQTIHLFEVWNQLMITLKNEYICQVKINQINMVLHRFKEIYAIYNYLSKTNLKNMIYEINKSDMKNIDMDKLKNKIALAITQIDGAIVKLDKILEEKPDERTGKSEDVFSKELMLMLGTTVLDNAFLRKLVYSLIFSILQDKSAHKEEEHKNN